MQIPCKCPWPAAIPTCPRRPPGPRPHRAADRAHTAAHRYRRAAGGAVIGTSADAPWPWPCRGHGCHAQRRRPAATQVTATRHPPRHMPSPHLALVHVHNSPSPPPACDPPCSLCARRGPAILANHRKPASQKAAQARPVGRFAVFAALNNTTPFCAQARPCPRPLRPAILNRDEVVSQQPRRPSIRRLLSWPWRTARPRQRVAEPSASDKSMDRRCSQRICSAPGHGAICVLCCCTATLRLPHHVLDPTRHTARPQPVPALATPLATPLATAINRVSTSSRLSRPEPFSTAPFCFLAASGSSRRASSRDRPASAVAILAAASCSS